jgi:predicted secreted protein
MKRASYALVALALLACKGGGDGTLPAQSAGPGQVPPPGPAQETIVHAEDDGRTFDVPRGGMVTFKLAGNAGTGFMWTVGQIDPNVLAQQGDHTNELESGAPGAPKMDVYRFVGNSPGSTVVEMDYRRPWGNAPPARAIHVTVNVR